MGTSTAGLVHPAIAAVAANALERLDGTASKTGDSVPATVEDQRAILERILASGGPGEVLLAGRHFDRFHEYPLFLVLLNSDRVPLLFDKVARLNRYLHSHHRHRVIAWAEGSVELEHVSTSGPPPSSVESLFVAGLYLAILEQIGCQGLRCGFPASGSSEWAFSEGRGVAVPAAGTTRWLFSWAGLTPRRPLPGLDELILENPGRDLEGGSFATRVASLAERDLSRRWTVRDLAEDLMVSPRTLQRRLREERTSLTAVIAESRMARARRLLVETSHSVTDIGYMLGFSDTPHFSRTFSAAEGMPPSRWRDRQGSTG